MWLAEIRTPRQSVVWIDSPYPVVALGLARALEVEGELEVGYGDRPATQHAPSLIVLHAYEIEDTRVVQGV